MKLLEKMFGGRASKKDTLLLAPVRMQAQGILIAFLENKYQERVTLTQLSIAASKFDHDRDYFFCEVSMQAYFYYAGMKKRFGYENQAPIPPCATMRIYFRADVGQVLKWAVEYITYSIADRNMNFPGRYEVTREECRTMESLPEVREFIQQFNDHRPWGFSIMPSGHDQVIWNINPKEELVGI